MRAVLIALLLSCATLCPAQDSTHQALPSGFAYPDPPDCIASVGGRVEYMAEHFWDSADMSDTALFARPRLMLDHLYLLANLPDTVSGRHVRHLIDQASRCQDTFSQVLFWLEHFVYDSSSPYYNEPLYEVAMRAVIASDVDTVYKLTPQMRLDMLSRNRIGQPAEDFVFWTKDSTQCRLYELPPIPIVLMFGHPACSLCHDAENLLQATPAIVDALQAGTLIVLSVTPDATWDEWQAHDYPAGWLVGIDAERCIYDNALYDIQRTPSFYLLDDNKRVLIKEASAARLLRELGIKP